MEREMRMQEDYIYELEDYLVEYSEKLRGYRRAARAEAAKKTKTSRVPILAEDDFFDDDLNFDDESEGAPNADSHGEADSSSDSGTDAVEIPDPSIAEPPAEEETPLEELQVPDLDIGEPISAADQTPSTFEFEPAEDVLSDDIRSDELSDDLLPGDGLPVDVLSGDVLSGDEAPLYIPSPVDFQSIETPELAPELAMEQVMEQAESVDSVAAGATLEYEPASVDRIVIQQVFRDTASGAEQSAATEPAASRLGSLLAVVEIWDESDEPIEADGTVSLMVMSADGAGGQRRLQRWDFTAEEAAAAWQSSQLGDGLHLELPLDGRPLPDEPLELWVRLVTADGQKFLTKLPFAQRELVAYGDDSMPPPAGDYPAELELLETRVAARAERTFAEQTTEPLVFGEADLVVVRPGDAEPAAMPAESNHAAASSGTTAPRWRTSLATAASSGSFATTANRKPTRWSAQQSAKRQEKAPLAVASPKLPKPLAGNAANSSPTNRPTVWKTVRP